MEHFTMIGESMTSGKINLVKVVAENERLKLLIDDNRKHFFEDLPAVDRPIAAQPFYRDALKLYRDMLGNLKNIAEAVAGEK